MLFLKKEKVMTELELKLAFYVAEPITFYITYQTWRYYENDPDIIISTSSRDFGS